MKSGEFILKREMDGSVSSDVPRSTSPGTVLVESASGYEYMPNGFDETDSLHGIENDWVLGHAEVIV